jgi:hypothetical protein
VVVVAGYGVGPPENPHDLTVRDCHENEWKSVKTKDERRKSKAFRKHCRAHSRVQKDGFNDGEAFLLLGRPRGAALRKQLDVKAKPLGCRVQDEELGKVKQQPHRPYDGDINERASRLRLVAQRKDNCVPSIDGDECQC